MNAITLMYHDIVSKELQDSSGLRGTASARYKIDPTTFKQQMQEVESVAKGRVATVMQPQGNNGVPPVYLTFDDGGVTAQTVVMDVMDHFGWKAHFFIHTDYIGRQGFMDGDAIRELHRRGHIIGSHMRQHPFNGLPSSVGELIEDWRLSLNELSSLIGDRVFIGSVPGGLLTKEMVQAARQAGIEELMTSEPTHRAWVQEGMNCWGRFAIRRTTPLNRVRCFLRGGLRARIVEQALWRAKKLGRMRRCRAALAQNESSLGGNPASDSLQSDHQTCTSKVRRAEAGNSNP